MMRGSGETLLLHSPNAGMLSGILWKKGFGIKVQISVYQLRDKSLSLV